MNTYTFDMNYNPISDIVGNSSIVSFGEATHRVVELHEFAADMFKYLVINEGFRVLVFESAWELLYKAQQYFESDEDDIYKAIPDMPVYLNAFDSESTAKLLKWIKDFNKNTTEEDKIIVAGYQPEQIVSDFNDIKRLIKKYNIEVKKEILDSFNEHPFFNGEFKNDTDALNYYGKKYRTRDESIELGKRMRLINAVNEFKDECMNNTDIEQNDYILLQTRFTSILGFIGGINYYADKGRFTSENDLDYKNETNDLSRTVYTQNDLIRFNIFNNIKQSVFKDKKIMIWQHVWHAFKRSFFLGADGNGAIPPTGTVSFGSYAYAKYGDDYKLIASILPKKEDTDLNTIDYAFKKKYKENFKIVNIKADEATDLPVNTYGKLYETENDTYMADTILDEQCDGVFYAPKFKFTYERG